MRGNASDLEQAAAALRALNADAAASVELPPGAVLNPTPEQIAKFGQELRPLGIKVPDKIHKNGWSMLGFAAAKLPHFTDGEKESAVAGCIASGLFDKLSAADLIPNAACAAAYLLREGTSVNADSVNDYIAFHENQSALEKFVGKKTTSWREWPCLASDALAFGGRGGLEYALEVLSELHQKREDYRIGKALIEGALSREQAHAELGKILHGAKGAFDFSELDALRFNAERLHEKPEPVILLDGKPICTAGNISVIHAKPKGGKSACISAVIGSAIVEDDEAALGDRLGWSVRRNPESHALIHLDTEQSHFDHEQIVIRACRYAGIEKKSPPAWVRSYCVTSFSTEKRRATLTAEIERANRDCGGILGVLVDGIGDFVPSVNDEEATHEFVMELHALAIKYNTVLLLVLHENPGEEKNPKTRGHLGSHLERKGESNIRIVKDAEEICSIYTERSRHTHIPKSRAHCFRWDEAKGMHLTCTVERPQKDESDLVEAIFACDIARQQAGGLLWAQVADRLIELGLSKNKDSAKTRISKLSKTGWLEKRHDHYWPSHP